MVKSTGQIVRQHFILGAFLLSLATVTTVSASSDFCHDKKVNKGWAYLARQKKDNDTVQRLYALRVGLCVLAERTQLDRERASRIFDRARNAASKQSEKHDHPQRRTPTIDFHHG